MDLQLDRTYFAYTLVDITPSGVIRSTHGNELERNQQRNWETVLQCIGLIAQPETSRCHTELSPNIRDTHLFGEIYEGPQQVWSFCFRVDREDVFRSNNNELGLLEDCFDEVPVITYLTETAKFLLPIFYTSGAIKNIYFKSARGVLK